MKRPHLYQMPVWQARVNHELGVLTFEKPMAAAAFFHAQLKIVKLFRHGRASALFTYNWYFDAVDSGDC
jgi:hypothetical protein